MGAEGGEVGAEEQLDLEVGGGLDEDAEGVRLQALAEGEQEDVGGDEVPDPEEGVEGAGEGGPAAFSEFKSEPEDKLPRMGDWPRLLCDDTDRMGWMRWGVTFPPVLEPADDERKTLNRPELEVEAAEVDDGKEWVTVPPMAALARPPCGED